MRSSLPLELPTLVEPLLAAPVEPLAVEDVLAEDAEVNRFVAPRSAAVVLAEDDEEALLAVDAVAAVDDELLPLELPPPPRNPRIWGAVIEAAFSAMVIPVRRTERSMGPLTTVAVRTSRAATPPGPAPLPGILSFKPNHSPAPVTESKRMKPNNL
jgi:hypothetical protein